MEKLTPYYKENSFKIPFDQFQRYQKTADLILQIKDQKKVDKVSILDVGASHEMHLKYFLQDETIYFLDKSLNSQTAGNNHFVIGDAIDLPFADKSIDIVVSVDVYEHIRPEKRESFISELYRIAKYGAILCAPFDTRNVSCFESISNEFFKLVHNNDHLWLKEHIENGLPDLNETLNIVKKESNNIHVSPNGYLYRWLKLIQLHFLAECNPAFTSGYMESIYEFYNKNISPFDNQEPCYRYFLIFSRAPLTFHDYNADDHKEIAHLEKTLDLLINNFKEALQFKLRTDLTRLQNEFHKLNESRNQLQDSNNKLQDSNNQLQEFNNQLKLTAFQLEQSMRQVQNEYETLQYRHSVLLQTKSVMIANRINQHPLIKNIILFPFHLIAQIINYFKRS